MSTPSNPTAHQQVFDVWKEECLAAATSFTATTTTTNDSAEEDPNSLESKARQYFVSLLSSQSLSTDALETNREHVEPALAKLIQSLEPALTSSSLKCRKQALACLKGVLSAPCMVLSLNVTKLVGNYLLPQCGPIKVEDVADHTEGDLDEQVRDAAVQTISTLLSLHHAQQQHDHDPRITTTSLDSSTVKEHILYRVHLSKEAIQLRCAVEDNQDEVDTMEKEPSQEYEPVAPRGLATLPRSRRSICFQLLQSTLNGMKPFISILNKKDSIHPITTFTRKEIANAILPWSELSIHCLHGESDPRCLIQLLHLLSNVMQTFQHVLEQQFPVDAMFDAVSAYYPIQFTPPPHMAHTVTKEDLTASLWNILSFTQYDAPRRSKSRDTMFSLTLGLVLDQLVPLPEDGPATVSEQREALKDLADLLGVQTPAKNSTSQVLAISQQQAEVTALAQIASALRTVHSQTAVPGASQTSLSPQQQVSVQCRDLISCLALACEQNQKEKKYWKVFVKDVTSDIVRGSASSWSRPDIVYLACLAGCGGLKAMKLVLDQSLLAFVRVVTDTDLVSASKEDEFAIAKAASTVSTALYGIASLLAAVQTSLKLQPKGVVLSPHPLEAHGSKLLDELLLLWKHTNETETIAFFSLQIANVRAIETLLMVLPTQVFSQEDQLQRIIEYWANLRAKLTLVSDVEMTKEDKQLSNACSKSLGFAIGEAMNESQGLGENLDRLLDFSILRQDVLRTELQEIMLPFLLDNMSSPFGRTALAVACERCKGSANAIIEKLVSILITRANETDDPKETIQSVASIVIDGGRNASEAWQNSDFLLQLRSVLLPQRSSNVEANLGVSMLELPSTAEENDREATAIGRLVVLLEPLLPIYNHHVSESHLKDLFVAICKVVPPLDSSDMKRFAVLLPFLTCALENATYDVNKEMVSEMVSFLPEFILSDASSSVRSYAVGCLSSLLSREIEDGSETCPCLGILESNAMPTILKNVRIMKELARQPKMKMQQAHKITRNTMEALLFTGSMASSAIQRSGPSLLTADKAVTFLVSIACCSKAQVIASNDSAIVDISVAGQLFPEALGSIMGAAAAGFGGILCAGPNNALWKQRLSFVAWKQMQKAKEQSAELSVGLVGTSAYILCSNKWSAIPSSMSATLTEIVVEGLLLERYIPGDIRKVQLAAIVKLLSLKHSIMEKNLLSVVTAILRAYAASDADHASCIIPCKLLALQALESIPTLLHAKGAVTAVKPAVIAILEQAMVEKSSILRHAAVEVRNSWFVV